MVEDKQLKQRMLDAGAACASAYRDLLLNIQQVIMIIIVIVVVVIVAGAAAAFVVLLLLLLKCLLYNNCLIFDYNCLTIYL